MASSSTLVAFLMPTFPPEIWTAVGSFLMKDGLIGLMGLSSTFLSLTMDARVEPLAFFYDDYPDALISIRYASYTRLQRLRKDLSRALKPFRTFGSANRKVDNSSNILQSLKRISFDCFYKLKMVFICSSS
ncbi:hypothetical protein CPB84DRAFT_1230689 [Gymnopilus junonius]|uniref:Uncharacterized protein n=1 Tax=Gymnopilus junonius TaxID=109634 RepID=A0A9P5NZH9_GYMJU|nr:hypothetical protein CPB84DRAFT_1230689 [Gymnopilus junonius]